MYVLSALIFFRYKPKNKEQERQSFMSASVFSHLGIFQALEVVLLQYKNDSQRLASSEKMEMSTDIQVRPDTNKGGQQFYSLHL